MPRVSILVPNLNSYPFIVQCVECIKGQSYGDWEVVICDSGSTDGSLEVLTDFERADSRVRIYNVEKEGVYAGWNECLSRATGEYVYIATADDAMSEDFLQTMVDSLDAERSTDIAFSRLQIIDEEGRPFVGRWERYRPVQMASEQLNETNVRLGACDIVCSFVYGHLITSMNQMLIRRSLFAKTGKFPLDCGPAGDVYWQLKASSHTDLMFVSGPMAFWRKHDCQITSNNSSSNLELCYKCNDKFVRRLGPSCPLAFRRALAVSYIRVCNVVGLGAGLRLLRIGVVKELPWVAWHLAIFKSRDLIAGGAGVSASIVNKLNKGLKA